MIELKIITIAKVKKIFNQHEVEISKILWKEFTKIAIMGVSQISDLTISRL